MKKILIIILISAFLFSACGTSRVGYVSYLSPGMTQYEVNRVLGAPIRSLSTSYYEDGTQEVFEYHTYQNEAYAIEFWNGEMTRYDFMHEEMSPVVVAPVRPAYPVPPPQNRPPQNVKPVKPTKPRQPAKPTQSARPTTPSRPGQASKPANTERPTQTSRPGTSSSRPTSERPTNGNTRPTTETSRPVNNAERTTNSSRTTTEKDTQPESRERK